VVVEEKVKPVWLAGWRPLMNPVTKTHVQQAADCGFIEDLGTLERVTIKVASVCKHVLVETVIMVLCILLDAIKW